MQNTPLYFDKFRKWKNCSWRVLLYVQDSFSINLFSPFKIYKVINVQNEHQTEYCELDAGCINWLDNFTVELNNRSSDGWTIDSYNTIFSNGVFWSDVILKRLISE